MPGQRRATHFQADPPWLLRTRAPRGALLRTVSPRRPAGGGGRGARGGGRVGGPERDAPPLLPLYLDVGEVEEDGREAVRAFVSRSARPRLRCLEMSGRGRVQAFPGGPVPAPTCPSCGPRRAWVRSSPCGLCKQSSGCTVGSVCVRVCVGGGGCWSAWTWATGAASRRANYCTCRPSACVR